MHHDWISKPWSWVKEVRCKKVNIVWFNVYEILEQAKLIFIDGKLAVNCLGSALWEMINVGIWLTKDILELFEVIKMFYIFIGSDSYIYVCIFVKNILNYILKMSVPYYM